jgi:hypothetical protein
MSTIIEKYMKEELSTAESEKVEAALIKEMFVQEQKTEWKKRIAQERASPLSVIWRKPAISSAIAAMLLLGIALFVYSQKEPAIDLADAYLKEKLYEPQNYMGEKTSEDFWTEAKEAYRNNQYEKTVSSITQISEKTEEQFFCLGLAFIYQKTPNYDLAAQAFLNTRTKGTNYRHETAWYLSLAYLKAGNKEKAKKELERIVATNGWNVENAKKILEKY